jgi:cell division protein FtsQ
MTTGRGSGATRSRGLALFPRRRRAARRPGGRRLRVRLPRPAPRVIAAVVLLLALLGGAWLWVRQSPLVAVKRVTVAGASGPDASQIRAALISAARDMTTLDVQMSHLRTAVSPFPVVKGLRVTTQFPHGMRIEVTEHVPVAVVEVDGRSTPVAGDGTLLTNVTTTAQLPSISLTVAPGGPHLTGIAHSEAQLLAAAPYALLAKIQLASSDATHGLVVQLRDGPRVYFGSGGQLSAKWSAVTAVLASSSSAGAEYIDVSVPSRPASGAGSDGGASASSSSSTVSGTTTSPAVTSTSQSPSVASDSTGGTGTTG